MRAVLTQCRYGTDTAGYQQMLAAGRQFPHRVWAVEGCSLFKNPAATLDLDESAIRRLALFISGIEVTQAVQFFQADRHLNDPADRQRTTLCAWCPASLPGSGSTSAASRNASEDCQPISLRRPGRLRALLDATEAAERAAVELAKDQGATWQQIGRRGRHVLPVRTEEVHGKDG